MSKIQLMKPELANLIAAGEVIERPSSVIKELVENSIDAGSKNIYIGIVDAGKGKIIVKDDGSGMDREDAIHCFLRHASSKIKTEYDLTRIKTLGFRGEAIPSIAAVSKVKLITSDGIGEGTEVVSVPNQELVINDAASRKGTVFEISDLFFNTPARLKYLKSTQAETYHVIETCEHLALGFPEISFSLVVDGKEIFRTSGRNDFLECIQKIYGNDVARSLYPIHVEELSFTIDGFISKPEINYSKRKNLLTFLNSRCIYDYRINKAIEDAYKDYLPPLRYPLTALRLTIDSSLVDVNVHPTKKEVRISCEDEIASTIRREISLILENRKPIYFMSEDPKTQRYMSDEVFNLEDIEKETTEKQQAIEPITPASISKDENKSIQQNLPLEESYESRKPYSESRVNSVSDYKETNDLKTEQIKNDYYKDAFEEENYSHKLPSMHPVAQVLETYIICDGDDAFYLIDQHAAAERINYEKTELLFSSIRSRIVPLFPIVIELTPKEKAHFDDEHIARLAAIGIIVKDFGFSSISVTEIPSFLNEENMSSVVSDCVHSCLNDEADDPISLLHLTIANIACKMSIKANHIMPLSEMEALIKDLAKCKNPANCPHGRPTLIKLTKEDVERIFRRSGF